VVIIIENTAQEPSVATEASTEAPAESTEAGNQEAVYLKLAQNLRRQFQATANREIKRRRGDGHLNRTDVVALQSILGVPGDTGEELVTLQVPVTAYHRFRARGANREDLVNKVKESSASYIASLPVEYDDEATIDYDNIRGLPDNPEPAEGSTASETAEQILAGIEAKKTALVEWVRERRERWCEDGINESLDNAGLDKLPVSRYYDVIRPLVGGGTATESVYATSPEEAIEKATWTPGNMTFRDATFDEAGEITATVQ
jgi:hypothetical protein